MPPPSRKEDSTEIEHFLRGLADQNWIKSTSRSWWPRFLFHHTDVRNAIQILTDDKLICRTELERRGRMIVDNASPMVIAATDERIKAFVRLYFRPKTPTEFRSEGMRPRNQRQLGAHCPMPVFFLFDSADLLTRADCKFSGGNLAAAGTQLFETAAELSRLDFKKIYHVGAIPEAGGKKIIYHRNAEVIIPDELDLTALKYIVCRSRAELETFSFLLPRKAWSQWSRRIIVESRADLFHRKWSFVETVEMTPSHLAFSFSPDTETPGPFKMDVTVSDLNSGRTHRYLAEVLANKIYRFRFAPQIPHYSVHLKLDEDLAYSNEFQADEDVPF